MKLIDFIRLISDCARRDFTINAIAIDQDGRVIDPFNGQQDIQDRFVRFVGDPAQRIQEDYLRIMRFFRFTARYDACYDPDTLRIIREHAGGLAQISQERIWSELSKIIVSEHSEKVVKMMKRVGVIDSGIPIRTSNPVFALMSMRGNRSLLLARDEQYAAAFYEDRPEYSMTRAKRDLTDGVAPDLVMELYRIRNGEEFPDWTIPEFPVRGQDLLNRGMKQGKELGEVLKTMRERWIASDYTLDREALLL